MDNTRLNSLLARLLIGSAMPLALFLAVALVAWIVIGRLRGTLALEQHTHEVIDAGLVLERKLDQALLEGRSVLLSEGRRLPAGFARFCEQFRSLGQDLRDKVRDNQRQVELLDDVLKLQAGWQVSFEAAVQTRQHELAAEADALLEQLQSKMQQLIDAERGLLAERNALAQVQARQSVWAIAVALVLAMGLTAVLAWTSARGVTRPVNRLIDGADELIAGRFSTLVPEGPAEIARLIVQFNHMALTLSHQTAALRSEEERYRTYIGAISHILWSTDPAGEVTADLPTWRAFTGQDEKAIRGWGWMDAVHPEDRPAVEQVWRKALADGSLFDWEYRLHQQDGGYRWFHCRGVPVRNKDGKVREWIGTCTDISERKEEVALRAAKEAAEAANKAKSEFLAKMSHELRTPLNAVIGMSRMLATRRFGPLTDKQADYLTDITQAGEHLLALINDILDLAKVEAGRLPVHPETFTLGEVLAATLSPLQGLAEGQKVTLQREDSLDGTMHTDPARLRQVLFNLLSNAVKFTPAGGKVTLGCQWVEKVCPQAKPVPETQAAALRVEVRDTGPGIAPKDHERIWEEFRQLDVDADQAREGTGLGLPLTRRLVALLGGTVWLESAVGQGSTFAFVLPRRVLESGSNPEFVMARRAAQVAADKPVVLIVEDHPPTHKLLIDWLTQAGLSTVSAFDGDDGLQLARSRSPRLIVLDIQLPRRDGWQVLTELKSDPATSAIPVVIVSVVEDRGPGGHLGVRDFFVKPVDREPFLRRLRELLPASAPTSRVLLVDDDAASRTLLADVLRAEGLAVAEIADGRTALAVLEGERPELVLLDLVMPEMDGFQVVEEVRRRPELATMPIVIVTAKDLTDEDRQRLNGRIQALLAKEQLTPEKLRGQLAELGLVG